jgi:osmotically-inducible protein OsmY
MSWLQWVIGRVGVVRRVERRLQGKPYLALKNVSCSHRGGVLTLSGCLATSSLREIAEAIAARVKGVERVENKIEVVAPASPGREGAPAARPVVRRW